MFIQAVSTVVIVLVLFFGFRWLFMAIFPSFRKELIDNKQEQIAQLQIIYDQYGKEKKYHEERIKLENKMEKLKKEVEKLRKQ